MVRTLGTVLLIAFTSGGGAMPQARTISAAELLRQAESLIQQGDFSKAEAVLEQAIYQDPADSEARYRLGYVLFRQRKLSPARNHFQSVVRAAPPAYYSRYFLGRIALLENQPKDAITWLEPVVAAKETVLDAASQLAQAYAAAGEPRKAIQPLKTAIAAAPWDGALYYRIGQLYRQMGEVELARESFDTSTRLKAATREDVETLMHTSQLVSEGKATAALESGARILGRADADPNALVALGVIYGNAQYSMQALDAFQKAAERDPKYFQAQFNHGLALLKIGRANEALAPLSRAAELLPQSQDAMMTLGLAAVMNQRYKEAIPPLEEASKKDPSNSRLRALLATAYLRTEQPAKAVAILKNPASESKDPAPVFLLVEALAALDKHEEALAAARQAQRRFPAAAQSHMAVAQQLARLGRYQEARPAFEETLKLAPGQKEAELGLADSLQKAGEHESAVAHYRAAGDAPAARLGLARSLVALKRLDEAKEVLEPAVRDSPEEIPLRLELSRVYARLGKADLAAEQTQIIEKLRKENPGK